MKKLLFIACTLAFACNNPEKKPAGAADAEQFYVYKSAMGNVCKVQRPTERPLFGKQHLGPFKDKASATAAMCKDIDPQMENTARCWACLPEDACK